MGFLDLRSCLKALEKAGDLRRITAQVSPVLEITEIADRVVKRQGPALLFEHVQGSSMPVAINLFGSPGRVMRTLEVGSWREWTDRVNFFLEPKVPTSLLDKVKTLPKLAEVAERALANIDPQRDLEFVTGPAETLDHASRMPWWGSKVGIDATRKWPSEGFDRPWPDDIVMSNEIKAKIDALWAQLGLDH
jgi:3-polyprenyl-4-hydroxybenzoate decarboxylase